MDARKKAALNLQALVLGEMLSYGEVVIAYRQHAGEFPKFVKFVDGVWKVGTVAKNNAFTFKSPEEAISDTPT